MRRFLDQKLKLRQLRAIAAIGAHGNLIKASQTLGISQPALTKTLREIEDMMGVRLFERHARGLDPNAQGSALVEAAGRILSIVRETEEERGRRTSRPKRHPSHRPTRPPGRQATAQRTRTSS